jgi:hypothetical protein
VVVLLRGRASTHERGEQQLRLAHRVAQVCAIPPSCGASIDRVSVRAKLVRANYVAEITDCIKHDELAIIRRLQGGELPCEHVPTEGGPARIIRELVDRAGKLRRSAEGPPAL